MGSNELVVVACILFKVVVGKFVEEVGKFVVVADRFVVGGRKFSNWS